MLTSVVEGVLLANKDAIVRATENAVLHGNGLEPTTKEGNYNKPTKTDPFADLKSYKARPLDGIWATAPYLHNGSVPTLHDLMLPEDQRPTKFAVGQLEYDPVKVGYIHDPEDQRAPFVFDTSLPGNSNQGHNFAANLNEDERWALVEFLKTL